MQELTHRQNFTLSAVQALIEDPKKAESKTYCPLCSHQLDSDGACPINREIGYCEYDSKTSTVKPKTLNDLVLDDIDRDTKLMALLDEKILKLKELKQVLK